MAVKTHHTDDQTFSVLVPDWSLTEEAWTKYLAERGVPNLSYAEMLELEDRDEEAARTLTRQLENLRFELHEQLRDTALRETDEFLWLRERGYTFQEQGRDLDAAGRSWVKIRLPDRNHAFQFKLRAELAGRAP